MTTQPHTSSTTFKTLRGVFEEPKMNHRRDFLRENKLNLREIQKNTTHKLIQQKQELDRIQHKHLQRYKKSQEQNVPRRSDSQCRNVEPNEVRQSRVNAGGNAGAAVGERRPNHLSFKRANSQQRESHENIERTSYEQNIDSIPCCCSNAQQKQQHHHHHQSKYREHVPRSASNISVISKAESCDKEIQTEDINDEDFLYEALKKCSSSEVHQLNKQKSLDQMRTRDNCLTHSNASLHTQQYDHGLKSINSRERAPFTYQDHYEDNKCQPDQISQYTSRSQYSHRLNGHNHETHVQDNGVNEGLEQNFQNLKIDPNMQREHEQQSSARSRQTLCSTTSKKTSNESVHKLGCRDDLRLPRYLEKEKRAKEEDRLREMNKDPNCPFGHYALSEHERLNALQKAQHKMSSLINELNHMPMTTETLRLRHRKVEIEKELQQLEVDIRIFSKPKVYVTEPHIQY